MKDSVLFKQGQTILTSQYGEGVVAGYLEGVSVKVRFTSEILEFDPQVLVNMINHTKIIHFRNLKMQVLHQLREDNKLLREHMGWLLSTQQPLRYPEQQARRREIQKLLKKDDNS